MIRVAVVGVGSIGQHHARVYGNLPQADLVGVVDNLPDVAERIAGLNATTAYTSVEALLDKAKPQAVTVAVPTALHFGVAKQVLEAGCHVLIEKPIAATIEEAAELVQLAKRLDRVLVVGHIERFNPAVIELKRRIDSGELGRVFQIHTRRLGPFPGRTSDGGVVIDLATHDLDIMRYITAARADRVYAETQRHIRTSDEDILGGLLRFSDDTLGILEINWLTPHKIRDIYVTGERGMFLANYLTQDLFFQAHADVSGSDWEPLSELPGANEGEMMRYAVKRQEPLVAEQEAFLAAIQGNATQIALGEDGIAALALALALIESGKTHTTIDVNI